jgi:hypothetical protein
VEYPNPAAALGSKDAKNKSQLAASCKTPEVTHAFVSVFMFFFV